MKGSKFPSPNPLPQGEEGAGPAGCEGVPSPHAGEGQDEGAFPVAGAHMTPVGHRTRSKQTALTRPSTLLKPGPVPVAVLRQILKRAHLDKPRRSPFEIHAAVTIQV